MRRSLVWLPVAWLRVFDIPKFRAAFARSLARLQSLDRSCRGIRWARPVSDTGQPVDGASIGGSNDIIVSADYTNDIVATASVLIHEGYHSSSPAALDIWEEEFFCHALEAEFRQTLPSAITAQPLGARLEEVVAAYRNQQLIDWVMGRYRADPREQSFAAAARARARSTEAFNSAPPDR